MDSGPIFKRIVKGSWGRLNRFMCVSNRRCRCRCRCLVLGVLLSVSYSDIWAQGSEFKVVDLSTELGESVGFYGGDYASNRTVNSLPARSALALEISLGQYADIYSKTYDFDLDRAYWLVRLMRTASRFSPLFR